MVIIVLIDQQNEPSKSNREPKLNAVLSNPIQVETPAIPNSKALTFLNVSLSLRKKLAKNANQGDS